MTNPLLTADGLPAFDAIRPEHVEPAVDRILADNRAALDALLSGSPEPTWEAVMEPLEAMDDRLSQVWGVVSHLNGVVNSEPLRAAYNACLPKLSAWTSELAQNETLFRTVQAVREADAFHQLSTDRQRTVDNTLRDFRLAGVDLAEADKARFRDNAARLSELGSRFQENVLDATDAWHRTLPDAGRLAGIPETGLAMLRQAAESRGESGYRIGLDIPSVLTVLSHCEDRALREEVYTAFGTRASDQGPHAGEWDNGPVMEEILALRHEQAQLLGFPDFAAKALAKRMAESPEAVTGFLEDLAARAHPVAEEELATLRRFAADSLGLETLEPWDIPFASEALRQSRHNLSQEDLRPYFPVDRVLDGLFAVVHRLFGAAVREATETVSTWHPDVRYFEVLDEQGAVRAAFYTDLFAREGKRGGAWMADCRSRRATAEGVQTPVAFLTCNFSPPVEGRPALLTHDEVLTLFHEFGHGLHHMLTRVDTPSVAGISGVPWDAVELPSQLMENWCWEREALDLFAAHVDTGDPLPDSLFQRMRGARTFQSAMAMVRQLEFSLFDFRLHRDYHPEQGPRILETLEAVRDEVAVVRPPAWHRFPHAFAHIFAGGYAAGYYSYKWAEVLSADAYSRFEDEGVFSAEAGHDFRTHILEKGGSEDLMTLYRTFRGRDPSVDALLRHSGLAAA